MKNLPRAGKLLLIVCLPLFVLSQVRAADESPKFACLQSSPPLKTAKEVLIKRVEQGGRMIYPTLIELADSYTGPDVRETLWKGQKNLDEDLRRRIISMLCRRIPDMAAEERAHFAEMWAGTLSREKDLSMHIEHHLAYGLMELGRSTEPVIASIQSTWRSREHMPPVAHAALYELGVDPGFHMKALEKKIRPEDAGQRFAMGGPFGGGGPFHSREMGETAFFFARLSSGDREDVDVLLKLLKKRDKREHLSATAWTNTPTPAEIAARTLGRWGKFPDRVVPVLLAAARDTEYGNTRSASIKALGSFRTRKEMIVEKLLALEKDLAEVPSNEVADRTEIVDALSTVAPGNDRVIETVWKGLRDPSKRPTVRRYLPFIVRLDVPARKKMKKLRELCKQERALRDTGVETVMEMDGSCPARMEFLLKSLRDHPPHVRRLAARALGKTTCRAEQVVGALTNCIRRDEDWKVVNAAVKALAKMEAPARPTLSLLRELQTKLNGVNVPEGKALRVPLRENVTRAVRVLQK